MNKKELLDKKIEIIKEFLKNNNDIETLKLEQNERKEIFEQADNKKEK